MEEVSSTGGLDGGETLWETTGSASTGPGPGDSSTLLTESATGESATGESATSDGVTGESGTTSGEPGLTTDDSGSSGGATGEPVAQDCEPGDPRLAGCWGFDDADGALVPDGSSNGNHGEATALELIDSPWGQALRGTPELVLSVSPSASLESAGALTVEMWVYLDALPGQGRMGLYEDQGECTLFVDADGLDCRTNGLKVSGVALEAAVWTHVACAIDGDTMRVFVDGELRAENTGAAPDVDLDKPVAIANSSMGWNQPLIGALDRVRVWSDALSQPELCALAEAPGCSP